MEASYEEGQTPEGAVAPYMEWNTLYLTLVFFLKFVMCSATHRYKKSVLLLVSFYKETILIFE